MVDITDGILEVDEPELQLPEGPRSLPVEVVNFTERVRAQAITTHGVNCPYAQSVQLLNADPLRDQAQITCFGDGQLWLCHSKTAADSIASFLDSAQGVSQLASVNPPNQGASSFSYVLPNPGKLIGATYTFTASAVVANRFLQAQILDNTGAVVFQVTDGGPVVASTSSSPFMAVGGPSATAAQFAGYQTLPNIPELPQGWSISFTVAGGPQAGDTFTGVRLVFQQGVNAGPAFDEVDGVPITTGVVMPVGSTSGLWAVATGDNMFAGVLAERRQA